MSFPSQPHFRLLGDEGLLVEFENRIAPEINDQVLQVFRALSRANVQGIKELVPAYRTLLIIFNPLETDPPTLKERVLSLGDELSPPDPGKIKEVPIPVCYGGEMGPDLGEVARMKGLTEEEVIYLHSGAVYRVYMLGFTPGFPYLGGLPPQLATPRLATPRTLVPAGSVGIANEQTGIYPFASPGGWRLIGRTPLSLFSPDREPPSLLSPGDSLRFFPITREEFEALAPRGEK